MFKTDPASLEALSFALPPEHVATLRAILERAERRELLTLPTTGISEIYATLQRTTELQLNKRIYAFHIIDEFADFDYFEGVELYVRQGKTLEPYFQSSSREAVPQIPAVIKFLKAKRITQIYTGQIPPDQGFLGLSNTEDPEDPITRDPLTNDEQSYFRSSGIEVIHLDYLL